MKKIFIVFAIVILSVSSFASDWSMNLGFNNPPGANVGLNFMNLWTNWAFEIGVGQMSSNTTSNNSTTVSTGGDVNLKYLFGSSWFRPYVQAGLGLGVSVGSGASAGSGTGFGGVGIFLLGQPIYAYISYYAGNSSAVQGGIGYRF